MAIQPLNGLSIADTGSPVQTYNQFGGSGIVYHKALANPLHLGHPWKSLEYVTIQALSRGQEDAGDEQLQLMDSIYYIHQGMGKLTINGTARPVTKGFLAIVPHGTRYSISNTSYHKELAFLVVELVPPDDGIVSQAEGIASLPSLLKASDVFHPASVGTQRMLLRVAAVGLSRRLSPAWGRLALVEIPPGGQVHDYCEERHDENLFIVAGYATTSVAGEQFHSWEQGLNVLIPRGVQHAIANRSSVEPLTLLSLLVSRKGVKGERT